ncbi:MAG: 50S ribosomal protein L6 [Kiritimatiellia bacterium]
MASKDRDVIRVPSEVKVSVSGSTLTASGKAGELSLAIPSVINAETGDGGVVLSRSGDTREERSLFGLTRSLVLNMIEGVEKGYSKTLEIEGVGFRANLEGNKLSMSVGFSSPVEYMVPDSLTVTVEGGTTVVVSGADKQKVGEAAAEIRGICPAEPYKGKGIKYKGERVRRKSGKTVA